MTLGVNQSIDLQLLTFAAKADHEHDVIADTQHQHADAEKQQRLPEFLGAVLLLSTCASCAFWKI
jgi:hypothetical protein